MVKKIFFFTMILLLVSSCSIFKNKRAVILGYMENAAELATVEFTVKKYVIAKKEKKLLFFIPLPDANFMAETEAVIKAGIDFNELQPDDVKINNKMIKITLPPVKIINFSYPIEKFKILKDYTNTNSFFNSLSMEDIDDFYRQAEINIRDNVNYLGIEKECQAKTRLFLTNFLKKTGYNEIYIEFKKQDKLFVQGPANE